MTSIGSLIIPVLNEGGNLENILRPLQPLRQRGWSIVVVDGGSVDDTFHKAKPFASKVITSPPGRAKQMNAGAAEASGEVLLFLHADTLLPIDFESEIQKFIESDLQWGRFDVILSGNQLMFNVIAWFINTRSRLTQVSTGDQALFFKRQFFEELKGYADVPLMEDVDICKRSRITSPPFFSHYKVITSSRRWEKNGTWKTIWLMWCLRYAYYKGVDPKELHRKYYS
ncbi:glycosyl transferase [Gammaproteobacteria bacterium 42_54_T18]|nr:glycosyl transferase [Gammaproteobacteria bacterium 42_54_T18]